MILAEHVALMEDRIDAYKLLVGKGEEKRPLGRMKTR
jgi:hypothetical protein